MDSPVRVMFRARSHEFRVAPYQPRDHAGVVRLVTSIQSDEFGIPIAYADQPDLQDIAGFFRRGAGEFWVARAGDDVIGSIGLIDIGGGQGALRKMFVHADWRGAGPGAGRGVAKALLDALLAHARQSDLRAVWLGTTEKFLAAHRFYEKSGFTEVPETALPVSFPRMKPDVKFYRISLADG